MIAYITANFPALIIVFLLGAASAEGVRRTFNKATGGRFFGKPAK